MKVEYEERMQERQEYAKNSYELGKAEWVILNKLPPEEAAKVQQKIQETMNSEISLKEQKKVLEEVFQIIEEYTAGEKKLIIIPSL